jgi:hypothetical protein
MSNLFSAKTDTVRKIRGLSKKTEKVEEFKHIFSSSSINQLCKRISEFPSKVDCTDYEFGKPLLDCQNKVKGDLFEIFCLIWMESFGGDRSIFSFGIDWAERDQTGIDFFAKNKFGHTLPIQSKFVANSDSLFESNRLETFFQEAKKYTVYKEGAPTVILFTSADKISGRYKHDKSMLVIDRGMINRFSPKENIGFWETLFQVTTKIF